MWRKPVPEQTAEPILQDLAKTFCQAALCFRDGEFSNPDPSVGFRGQVEPISTICAMVERFKHDQVPADILSRLCSYMRPGDEKRKNDLASDQSSSMAGDRLLQLIQRRVTEYVRREALRRDRA
jgi:hypothetical protein